MTRKCLEISKKYPFPILTPLTGSRSTIVDNYNNGERNCTTGVLAIV